MTLFFPSGQVEDEEEEEDLKQYSSSSDKAGVGRMSLLVGSTRNLACGQNPPALSGLLDRINNRFYMLAFAFSNMFGTGLEAKYEWLEVRYLVAW